MMLLSARDVCEKLTQAVGELRFLLALPLFKNKKKYYLKSQDLEHTAILPGI